MVRVKKKCVGSNSIFTQKCLLLLLLREPSPHFVSKSAIHHFNPCQQLPFRLPGTALVVAFFTKVLLQPSYTYFMFGFSSNHSDLDHFGCSFLSLSLSLFHQSVPSSSSASSSSSLFSHVLIVGFGLEL